MTLLTTNQKIKALIAVAMRLYNPDVMYTYTGQGSSENEAVAATKQTLRQHLSIKPDDTPIVAIFRMFIFYFVCGRYSAATAPLSLYPVHKDRTRSHLHVYLKPVKKGQKIIRENGRIEAAPYTDFSIPHYIGQRKIGIPNYTYGAWTIQLTLKDQSFIRLKTHTREEGIKTVLELGKHIDPKYLPDGGLIEKNLRVTEPNQGKHQRLDGIKIKAYKVEFYKFGEEQWEWAQNLS
jgi:hypothetical protein